MKKDRKHTLLCRFCVKDNRDRWVNAATFFSNTIDAQENIPNLTSTGVENKNIAIMTLLFDAVLSFLWEHFLLLSSHHLSGICYVFVLMKKEQNTAKQNIVSIQSIFHENHRNGCFKIKIHQNTLKDPRKFYNSSLLLHQLVWDRLFNGTSCLFYLL